MTDVPVYSNKPIASEESLARCLGIPVRSLKYWAARADASYSPAKPTFKSNGAKREIFRVSAPVKKIQQQILHKILHRVTFPEYLVGSLRGKRGGHIYNARLHAGQATIIREDISDFFPSITREHVQDMWKNLFHFPRSVAEMLTDLTTFKNRVPQGAATSPYIANLIFWDNEPGLVKSLASDGLLYTRYVDDIHVSSPKHLTESEVQLIRRKLSRMIKKKGLFINKAKGKVQSNFDPSSVHNLIVNSGRPTLHRLLQSRNRTLVRRMELHKDLLFTGDPSWLKEFSVVYSTIAYWYSFQPRKARPYFDRLNRIREESPFPLLS